MKKFLLILLIGGMAFNAIGQSEVSTTHFFYTPTLYNPAYSGLENYTDLKFGYQQLWTGVQDAPESAFALANFVLASEVKQKKKRRKVKYKSPYDIDELSEAYEIPNSGLRISKPEMYQAYVKDSIYKAIRSLDRKAREELKKKIKSDRFEKGRKHGLSVYAMSNKSGAVNDIVGGLGYAYHQRISKKWMMSLGVGGSLQQVSIDVPSLTVLNPEDATYKAYQTNAGNALYYGLKTGALFYNENFYISYGYGNTMIAESADFELNGDNSVEEHNLIFGYHISVSPLVQIVPSLLARVRDSRVGDQYTANIKAVYDEKYTMGMAIDQYQNVGMNAGFMFKDMYRVNYAYNMAFGNETPNQQGSHELVLSILLSRGKSPQPYIY